jgi:flagellar assembly protein FliH
MDVVGKAIKNLIMTDEEVPAPRHDPLAAAAQPAEFIPVTHIQTIESQPSAKTAEDQAIDVYRQRLALAEQHKQVLADLENEAKAQGYTAGFKVGEEKGEIQTRQNASAMFGKINELIVEFANLRNAVLDNVQHNFYELAQAVAEALLKREFKVSPDAFATVVRRAISEAVGPAKFKIRLHPDLYDRVAAIGPSDIVENLVKDSDIDVGDFKIESDLSVVDVSVRKLISDLLDQADLDLFDSSNGKKDKAG